MWFAHGAPAPMAATALAAAATTTNISLLLMCFCTTVVGHEHGPALCLFFLSLFLFRPPLGVAHP
jgi:hypothetical protein